MASNGGKLDSIFDFTGKGLMELKNWMQPWWMADQQAGEAVGQIPRLDALIPRLGPLLLWYRCGDTFTFPTYPTHIVTGALADDAAYGGTVRPLNYTENNDISVYTDWDVANRPTLGDPGLGSATGDDGAIIFNYDQADGSSSAPQAGCNFYDPSMGSGGAMPALSASDLAWFRPSSTGWATDGDGPKTLSVWLKPGTTAAPPGTWDNWPGYAVTNHYYQVAGGTGLNGWALQVNTKTRKLQFSFSILSIQVVLDGPSLVENNWYHVAVVYDGTSGWKLYLQGALVDSDTYTPPALTGGGPGLPRLGVGAGTYEGLPTLTRIGFFIGGVDEVTFFKKALSAAEVGELAISGGNLYSGTPGPGVEIFFVAVTSPVSITGTSSASPTTVATAPSFGFDGSTRIAFEFFCGDVVLASSSSVVFALYDGSTEVGRFATLDQAGNQPVYCRREIVPSNASHVYSVRAWKTGTVDCNGGNGTADNHPAIHLRLSYV